MRLATRNRACPACGRSEPVVARWCGDCGAALRRADDRGTSIHLGVDQPRVETPQPRRLAWAVVLVLVLAVAGALADPGAPDGTLLGDPDDATGRSSLQPPLDDLQLRWRRVVDGAPSPADGPVALADLAGGALLVDDEVVRPDDAGSAVALGPWAGRPDAAGRLLLASEGEVVTADATTGRVLRRAAVRGPWRPEGAALGWVAGAAVLVDAAGVLGAVTPDGQVRWTGDADWRWDGVGDGTDWLVVVAGTASAGRERILVVDGRTGAVHRDVGPTGVVHAPVVHGDVLVFVDPFAGIDRGLGHPVEVRGMLLDGSGQLWAATDLPPTSGTPTAVAVTAVDDAVAVHYWTAGHATTAIWFDPTTGTRLGAATVSGSGRTEEGWAIAAVVQDAIAHVDPVRDSIRAVDRRGLVRWSIPALPGEGVATDGGALLVRTPPRGTSLQSRLRLLDPATGGTRWSRTVESTEHQHLVDVVDDHVAVATGPASGDAPSWFTLDTGRRRTPPTPVGETPPLVAAPRRPGLVADDRLLVTVGATGLVARDPGDDATRWSRASSVLLRPDLALLLSDRVVVAGADGRLRAWDRADGTLRWTGPPHGVTALTAAGDALVLGTRSGEVLVLGPTGAVRQRLAAGTGPVEDVAVVAGRVVATVGQDVVGFGRGAAVVEPADRVAVP